MRPHAWTVLCKWTNQPWRGPTLQLCLPSPLQSPLSPSLPPSYSPNCWECHCHQTRFHLWCPPCMTHWYECWPNVPIHWILCDNLLIALHQPRIFEVQNPFEWMETISLQGITIFLKNELENMQKVELDPMRMQPNAALSFLMTTSKPPSRVHWSRKEQKGMEKDQEPVM